MDAISEVATNSIYQYLVEQIESCITAADRTKFIVIDAGVQRTGTDLPSDYVFYDINEGAPQKHTLAPMVYKRPVDIVVEIVSSTENLNNARSIRTALENLFLHDFSQYSIIVGEMIGKRTTLQQGYMHTIAIPLDYIYTRG